MGGEGSGRTVSQAGERRSARIESLRAIAALAVLAGHIVVVSVPGQAEDNLLYKVLFGGGLGVYFFFGLTGYLLFWPFAQRYFGDGDAVDLGRYAANRALRILPLYYVVVITVLAFADNASLGVWARFLTFTETTSALTAGNFVGPAWSLAIEVLFYALLPLLAFAIARLAAGSLNRALGIVLALGALSLACRVTTVYIPDPADPLWRFNLPSTFVFFVPGMAFALVRVWWERRGFRPEGRWWASAQLWFAASLVLWVPVLLISYHLDFLICLASFLAIGACVLTLRDGPLIAALDWRPLVAIGVASYSLYLWHLPVTESLEDVFATHPGPGALALVAVPASIAVALLSYRAIESPFLSLRRQWSRSSAAQEDEGADATGDPLSLNPPAPADAERPASA
jgi:peptidoglycan/LPS O-acetylase OafA/YrhL